MWRFRLAGITAIVLGVTAGCPGRSRPDGPRRTDSTPLTRAELEGRETWFKATFGGQKMFSLILPHPPFDLTIGFDAVLTSNRDTRFNDWGVLNDPDCTAGDASTNFFDRCADDAQIGSYNGASAGVVGI